MAPWVSLYKNLKPGLLSKDPRSQDNHVGHDYCFCFGIVNIPNVTNPFKHLIVKPGKTKKRENLLDLIVKTNNRQN